MKNFTAKLLGTLVFLTVLSVVLPVNQVRADTFSEVTIQGSTYDLNILLHHMEWIYIRRGISLLTTKQTLLFIKEYPEAEKLN